MGRGSYTEIGKNDTNLPFRNRACLLIALVFVHFKSITVSIVACLLYIFRKR